MKTAIFNSYKMSLALVSATLIFSLSGGLTPLLAHANPQLEEALKQSPKEQVSLYRQMMLCAQVANLYKMTENKTQAQHFFEASKMTAQKIHQPYLLAEAKAHLANEYASANEFEKSLALLKEIQHQQVRTHATWKVASKVAKAGDTALAKRLLEALEKEIALIQNPEIKAELLTGTGAKYKYIDSEKGVALVLEAYAIVQSFQDPFHKAIMLNELGANLIDIDQKQKAMEAFDAAEKLGLAMKDAHERAEVFVMHGGELAEKGERARATQSLRIALDAAKQMPEGLEKEDVLSEIARNFGQSYAFEEGIKVARMVHNPYFQAEGYIRIAKNMERQKRGDDANMLLQKTLLIADKIDDAYEKATILRKLASEKFFYKDKAHYEKLLKTIETIAINLGR